MSPSFDAMYAKGGRPSIPPEKLLQAQLPQMLYSVRGERLPIEEIDYSILFRWVPSQRRKPVAGKPGVRGAESGRRGRRPPSPRTATACWRRHSGHSVHFYSGHFFSSTGCG